MEYAAGGNLYQLVARSGGLPEPDARWYFQQLIFAIDYCHKMVSYRI
jgi:serine/threonine-protein kinase SRK2